MRSSIRLFLFCLASQPATVVVSCAAGTLDFNRDVQPILAGHCMECHGPDAAARKGKLRLDQGDGLTDDRGGHRIVVAGKPEESELISRITHADPEERMPPAEFAKKKPLKPEQIEILKRWIAEGAKYEKHWSLVPPANPAPPAVANSSWVEKPLDHFVLAAIEAAGQQPTSRADRRTLARRAWLDLHGLPPAAAEMQAFLLDNRPDAWPRLIDSLLASPRYGERWGRHWLDVARYSDSNGMDEDIAHPAAWRFRDYVIGAFNDDKPYDQFIVEQLAGDLLPAENPERTRAQTVGVGFLSVGPKMLACDDPEKMRRDIVDEQIDTTGRAFLGMTLGCARCHDHKFDPVSTADYYGLAGIFMSTKTLTKYSVVAQIHTYDLSDSEHKQRWAKIAELEKQRDKKETSAEDKSRLSAEIDVLRKDLPLPFDVIGVTENPTEETPVHVRGDYLTLGETVPRRVPVALSAAASQPEMPKAQSGRLELARWIASPENPFTARVIVNRVWRWHFGRGLVPTPDNFGTLGVRPTHPGLLDHLARRLVESGWSLKALHREIMVSATYRQSAVADRAAKEADPENALFARWQPRRVESEVVRDAILTKSGRLDLTMGGSMLKVRANAYVDQGKLAEYEKVLRRTVYLPVLRSSGYDSQNAFDFPDPALCEGDRRTSTVAPQALFLMNSPLVHESSKALADTMIEKTSGASARERAAWLVRHILDREATETERLRGETFLSGYAPGDEAATWSAFARVLFASNEFLYIE